jgi:hypothetical protein
LAKALLSITLSPGFGLRKIIKYYLWLKPEASYEAMRQVIIPEYLTLRSSQILRHEQFHLSQDILPLASARGSRCKHIGFSQIKI